MNAGDVEKLKSKIKKDKITTWTQVHDVYRQAGNNYANDKLIHAYTSLLEIENITSKQFTPQLFKELIQKSIGTKTWMSNGIYTSRAKDYTNPFRKMVYETNEEMNAVVGKLEDNQFIQDQFAEADAYKKIVKGLIKNLK